MFIKIVTKNYLLDDSCIILDFVLHKIQLFRRIFAGSNFVMMIQDEMTHLLHNPQQAPLTDFFQNHGKRLHLSGLAGSSLPLSIAPLLQDLTTNQLFVLPDRESSAFFYHDLEKLLADVSRPLEEKQVHYFPASYRRPYDFEEVDNA